MLHAEVFIYPNNKIGMYEYPPQWWDLVDGNDLKRIKQVGLSAAEAGKYITVCEVQLAVRESDKKIPLCSVDIHMRVHDLRNYPSVDGEEPIESWAQLTSEVRARNGRWSCAPTVDELYVMVDADLPRIAQMGRFLHGSTVAKTPESPGFGDRV